jgi:hypothetical protein
MVEGTTTVRLEEVIELGNEFTVTLPVNVTVVCPPAFKFAPAMVMDWPWVTGFGVTDVTVGVVKTPPVVAVPPHPTRPNTATPRIAGRNDFALTQG